MLRISRTSAAIGVTLILGVLGQATLSSALTTTSSSTTTTTTTTLPPRPTVVPTTQTSQLPSTGAPFTQMMQELWTDLITNNIVDARKLFIPTSAYNRIKAIPDPAYDWRVRLMAFFNLDFATYHRALISGQAASYLTVAVRPSYAQWIPAGYCENKLGYWHLPGPRFIYTQNGVTRSVGVYSLISWHGLWYIVHMGPNPRNTNGGELFNPAQGPGVVGPPGSC